MHECKTVTLRTRPLKNGMLSYYLDYYPGYRDKETMKVIRHESLGIYIYANPLSRRERDFNDAMAEKAEAVRCRRFEAIVNERYDFLDKNRLKGNFLEYFRRQLPKQNAKWQFVYLHFEKFVCGKCTFEEIDVDLCNRFRDYLLNARQLKYSDLRHLSWNIGERLGIPHRERAVFIKASFPVELQNASIEYLEANLRDTVPSYIRIDVPDEGDYRFHYEEKTELKIAV